MIFITTSFGGSEALNFWDAGSTLCILRYANRVGMAYYSNILRAMSVVASYYKLWLEARYRLRVFHEEVQTRVSSRNSLWRIFQMHFVTADAEEVEPHKWSDTTFISFEINSTWSSNAIFLMAFTCR